MKVLLLFIGIIISFSLYAQQGPDYVIMRGSGDTIYCDIMEDKTFYRPKKGEIEVTPRRNILYYNGFHAIMARIGKDSLLFVEASQISGYYQHNSLDLTQPFSRRNNRHPRPKGYYHSFDLGRRANYLKAGFSFRHVLAIEADEETLEGYRPKFNSPYKIYACYLNNGDMEWTNAYLLKKDKDIYFLGSPADLRKTGKKLNLDSNLWQAGGGNFTQRVLRFQFALNQLQSK